MARNSQSGSRTKEKASSSKSGMNSTAPAPDASDPIPSTSTATQPPATADGDIPPPVPSPPHRTQYQSPPQHQVIPSPPPTTSTSMPISTNQGNTGDPSTAAVNPIRPLPRHRDSGYEDSGFNTLTRRPTFSRVRTNTGDSGFYEPDFPDGHGPQYADEIVESPVTSEFPSSDGARVSDNRPPPMNQTRSFGPGQGLLPPRGNTGQRRVPREDLGTGSGSGMSNDNIYPYRPRH